jgi:choline dehydrogenase-like flavoprotein
MYLVGKPNVVVMAQTNSKRLVIEHGKAVGVEVIGPDGKDYTFHAEREVIVSSGVFESPKLLMLSGIGPAATLAQFGIDTVVDSPHVGQNLLDHPILAHVFRLKDGCGLDRHLLRAGLEKDAAVSAYRWKNKGPLTSGLLELVGLPRIDERLAAIPEYVEAKKAQRRARPVRPRGAATLRDRLRAAVRRRFPVAHPRARGR